MFFFKEEENESVHFSKKQHEMYNEEEELKMYKMCMFQFCMKNSNRQFIKTKCLDIKMLNELFG